MSDYISRQAAIEALEQIRYALWEIDIPLPTVPEYIEHHRDVQNVMKRIDEIRDKMERLPSAQPEREKGEWIWCGDKHVCSECDEFALCDAYDVLETGEYQEDLSDFCPHCGADMRGEQDDSI